MQLLRVPMYILPPPSAIFVQFALKLPRIWEYTLVTGAGDAGRASPSPSCWACRMGLLVAFSPLLRRTFYPLAVTLEMVPKIVFAPVFVTWLGLRLRAEDHHRLAGLLLPDPAERHPRLHLAQRSSSAASACSTGAGPLAHLLQGAAAGGPAAALRGLQGCGGQRHGRRHGRGMDRLRRRARLLHPAGASANYRMDIAFAIIFTLAALGLLAVLDRGPGRACADPLARLAAHRHPVRAMTAVRPWEESSISSPILSNDHCRHPVIIQRVRRIGQAPTTRAHRKEV